MIILSNSIKEKIFVIESRVFLAMSELANFTLIEIVPENLNQFKCEEYRSQILKWTKMTKFYIFVAYFTKLWISKSVNIKWEDNCKCWIGRDLEGICHALIKILCYISLNRRNPTYQKNVFSGNILIIIKFYTFSLISFKLCRQILWYLQNTSCD